MTASTTVGGARHAFYKGAAIRSSAVTLGGAATSAARAGATELGRSVTQRPRGGPRARNLPVRLFLLRFRCARRLAKLGTRLTDKLSHRRRPPHARAAPLVKTAPSQQDRRVCAITHNHRRKAGKMLSGRRRTKPARQWTVHWAQAPSGFCAARQKPRRTQRRPPRTFLSPNYTSRRAAAPSSRHRPSRSCTATLRSARSSSRSASATT